MTSNLFGRRQQAEGAPGGPLGAGSGGQADPGGGVGAPAGGERRSATAARRSAAAQPSAAGAQGRAHGGGVGYGRSPAARRYHALGLAHFRLPPSNVWAGLWQVRRSMIRIVRRAPRSAFQRHPYRVRTAFGDPARRAFFLLSA